MGEILLMAGLVIALGCIASGILYKFYDELVSEDWVDLPLRVKIFLVAIGISMLLTLVGLLIGGWTA